MLRKVKIETIEDLKRFLIEFFEGEEVGIFLFGSRARGDNSSFSDVDIAFLSSKDISDKLTLLREFIEESNFPYKVDLVDLSRANKLKDIVLRESIRWL
ncbi:hypothetical protein SAMN06265339_1209 [Desulfurobacterium pacificum]|uniref:Polymerase beta nucleotidyltransferase domain-containing protein n=1 Tax=Desulfurobacterium pacificum TaxID=240166 RepID=A0ABY1NNA5_9BACT|nr:nucleotidyltransferase domain-containing protein [Desulfurobacterium pacificum]SMP13957.1 hypothetical protein SAMN06265339_1209 [Desulfurobacterium pacificum]